MGKHSDLVEIFLKYLMPNHHKQVVKFLQRQIYENVNQLLSNLSIYMDQQKSQLDNIYSTLNKVSAVEESTMNGIRNSFLAILGNNPLLESWFLQLFPHPNEDLDSFSLGFSPWVDNLTIIPGYLVNEVMERRSGNIEEVIRIESKTKAPEKSRLKRLKKKRRKSTKIRNLEEKKAKKSKLVPVQWTREEDQLLVGTINGLEDCPEEKVLHVLFDTFPNKKQDEVMRRFYIILDLIKSMS